MKTLYLTGSSANIWIDPEIDEVGKLDTIDRYDIRQAFYIEEPMHVVYQCGEKREEIDAKKGEILIVFYDNRYNKYVLDTIRTKQWVANLKNRAKIEQKEKEEWAKKNASADLTKTPCCDCVECEG
jgi:hypothetical protein